MVVFETLLLMFIAVLQIRRHSAAKRNERLSMEHALENLASGGQKKNAERRGGRWFGRDVALGPEAAPREMI